MHNYTAFLRSLPWFIPNQTIGVGIDALFKKDTFYAVINGLETKFF